MTLTVTEQTLAFCQSWLLGAALTLFYDCLEMLRRKFHHPRLVIFLEDLSFGAVCAVAVFFFLLAAEDGRLRFYLVAGMVIGGVLYRLILGESVYLAARCCYRAAALVGRLADCLVLRPVRWFLRALGSLAMLPFRLIHKKLKFFSKYLQNSLKKAFCLLYNALVGNIIAKKKVKYSGQNKN